MGQYQYTSDLTEFMNGFLKDHPQVAAERLINRGKLWDVALNHEEQQDFKRAALPAKPYAYQSE